MASKHSGRDTSGVKPELIRVDKIYSTKKAIAAMLKDTTVVTWGDKDDGRNVTQVV